jgi:tetratricopeptide (TPR) repeat protein
MAQITQRLLTSIATVLLCLGPAAAARAQAPDPALAAETESRWDDAIRLHRAAIAADPTKSDLWIRIADIEAQRGNINDCIAALQQAAAAAPGTSSIYFRLSQAYSTAGQPSAALNAIEGALALEPQSAEYLKSRAVLSTWLADYDRARDSYERLVAIQPQDVEIALAFARVSAWSGDTNEAVSQYERYLKAHPDAADVWIELAKAESWRGNYGGAEHALKVYRERFGDTPAYKQTHAAVLTGAGRPSDAEEVIAPLLAQTPDDLQLNLTHTIALAMQNKPREAYSSLETVRQLAPSGREARDAERIVRTLLGSTVEPATFTAYSDSDQLEIQRYTPRGTFAFNSGTQISAGYDRTRLSARQGSGLESIDGSAAADFEQAWVGAAQKMGALTINGEGGYAKPGVQQDVVTYRIGAAARVSDSFQLAFQRSSGAVVISPRTVSLGLTQIEHRLQAEWAPTLQSTIAFDAHVQDFSDGNRRIEWMVAPRRSFARTAAFNLDLGVSAYQLETDHDLANGYYDPKRYEFYAVTLAPYFKFSENVGFGMWAAAGPQRDSYSPSFEFGGTVSGEATFGIYEPWAIKVTGSASMNRRLESGAFRGVSGGVVLVRRF